MRGAHGTTDHGSWELVEAAPGRRFGPGVLGYRGFRLDLDRPERRIEFASGMITLVVNVGGRVRVGLADAGAAPSGSDAASYASLVNGPCAEGTVVEHGGRIEGVEIYLTPWMAYTVLGLDMAETRGRILTLTDVLGPQGAELEERVAETPAWADRFALLDALLTSRCATGRVAAPQVRWAWAELVRTDGLVPLRRLSAVTGWSTRHIELRFRQQIGLSPKSASRVLRMQRALRMLTGGATSSAAAAACGFYDQAHLHRDFKAMTGCTPGQFLVRRKAAQRPVDRMPGRVTSALVR
jgi:AraC-like DNA-binding protein